MRHIALLTLLLTLLVALLVPAPAAALGPVEVVAGPATITITAPDASAPLQPDVAGLLLISVQAPPGTVTTVTVQTKGLRDEAGACRPVDSPDVEHIGWLTCEGTGAWALALTIPALGVAGEPALCDQLRTVPIRISIAVNYARVGARVVSAAYQPCRRLYLPLAVQ